MGISFAPYTHRHALIFQMTNFRVIFCESYSTMQIKGSMIVMFETSLLSEDLGAEELFSLCDIINKKYKVL